MFAVPCGWLIVMQQHASIHGHFLPRNFTCTILWAYLLLSRSVSFEKTAAQERTVEPPEELAAVEPASSARASA
jgi:hypothetical protein